MADFEDTITTAKGKMPNITPKPPGFRAQSNAYELKSRLQWGEPGLTIVDVREHDAFNQCHILGAITMPMDTLEEIASFSLMPKRDIYVYGASEEETTTAANRLREMGFSQVSELKGGLEQWKDIAGSLDGSATNQPPGADAYTLSARLREFANVKAKEKRMK